MKYDLLHGAENISKMTLKIFVFLSRHFDCRNDEY